MARRMPVLTFRSALRVVGVVALASAPVLGLASLCCSRNARGGAVSPGLSTSDGAMEPHTPAFSDAEPCPASWRVPPASDPKLNVPLDGGIVLLHAAADGTQNYACVAAFDGGAQWSLVGPNATLTDCHGTVVGRHFASDAGSALPEWQTNDGTFVVAQKLVGVPTHGVTPAVPLLLLRAVDAGGAGVLSRSAYVQRLQTDGGVASGACRAGDTARVPYTADYYFYGP